MRLETKHALLYLGISATAFFSIAPFNDMMKQIAPSVPHSLVDDIILIFIGALFLSAAIYFYLGGRKSAAEERLEPLRFAELRRKLDQERLNRANAYLTEFHAKLPHKTVATTNEIEFF